MRCAAPSTSARPGRDWRRRHVHHTRRLAGGAGKPLGARQQDNDEHGEHRHRSEDAADQEVGGLLEQPEHEAGDDGAAVVAHPAERDRHETVEGQHRRIGEEGEQHLRRRQSPRARRSRRRVAKLAMRRLRSGRPSARAA